MTREAPALRLFHHLPQIAEGAVGLYVVDATGALLHRNDVRESVSFRVDGRELVVETDPGRDAQVGRADGGGGTWLVVTHDADRAGFAPFLRGLFGGVAEHEAIKLDMESMESSSLALLEEVSMIGDMLPKLPTGETEIDVVRIGLESLLVGASVERAIFVCHDQRRDVAEVMLEVRADDGAADWAGERIVDGGLAARAISGTGEALLESVPEGGTLGAPGSPESTARREVIAVPVRYGGNDKPVTLGALLVIDKRPNAYASTDRFGSQDTKLVTSVAAVLGAALGTRKVTELGNEMRTAHTVHQQILPHGSPEFRGFDLAGCSVSPGAVGGDYYDFLEMPDGRLMCVVADVSGHNLASCLVMVSVRAGLRLLAETVADPGEIFDRLAGSLYGDLSRTELFLTAVGVALSPETRELAIANAGHNPTMILSAADGSIEEVAAEDTVLGFMANAKHDVVRRQLEPGDVVLLYTDGVTEAANEAGEMFGEDRLRDLIRAASAGSAQSILAAVYAGVSEFADESAEGDDISVVVIKVSE